MSELVVSRTPQVLAGTGLSLSPLAWGMWRFVEPDPTIGRATIEAVLECDINFIDTADIYGRTATGGPGLAETLLGNIIRENPGLRDRFHLATKGGILAGIPYDSSADYLARACEDSLRRLNVERIDLYQIHRPDLLAHPQEVAGALDRLVAAGKVGTVGVSNYTPSQLSALQQFLTVPLVSQQIEFSPLVLDPLFSGVLDQAMEKELTVLAWSPLGGGRLGTVGADPATRAVIALLDAHAQHYGVTRAAVACAWIMVHPAKPIPIIGSGRPQRIREMAQAFNVKFTRKEWYAILTASMGKPLP